jgi:hypothetical protein
MSAKALWLAEARIDASIAATRKLASGEFKDDREFARLQASQLTNIDLWRLIEITQDRVGIPRRTQIEQAGEKIPPLMLVFPDGKQPPYAKYARPPGDDDPASD